MTEFGRGAVVAGSLVGLVAFVLGVAFTLWGLAEFEERKSKRRLEDELERKRIKP